MKKITIITDSASDITLRQLADWDVRLVSMPILFGDDTILDDKTREMSVFWDYMKEGGILKTSLPSPDVFAEAFEAEIKAGRAVVCITIGSALSGTYQSAVLASGDYEDCICLVDSMNVSLGLQNLILYAVRLRDKGLSAPEIADELEKVKDKILVLAVFDTLEYLKQGGRISKGAAWAGAMLSIKPVISIVKGEVSILGKARGSKNGNNMLIQNVRESGGIDFSMPYCLGYTGLDNTLLQKYIQDSAALWEGKTDSLPISTIGAAIGTHAGPGAIGVSFFHL